MKKLMVLLVMVSSLLVTGLACQAESKEEIQDESSVKIGYVNMGKVIDSYSKAKEAEKVLRKEQEEKRKELEEKSEEITKLVEELQAKETVLKETEKQKRIKVIEDKKKALGDLAQKYDSEIKKKIFSMQTEVMQGIDKTVEAFAKEKGYTLILEAQQILYIIDGSDVTKEIIKLLNDKKR